MSHLSSTAEDSTEDELPPAPQEAPNAEDGEDEKFCEKAILFIFNTEKNEWVSHGAGTIKVLQHKDKKQYRILMRENQTYRVRLNHLVPYLGKIDMKKESNRDVTWTAFDSSGESEIRQCLAVRFAFPQIAEKFIDAFKEGQKMNKELVEASNE